jgi:hypothetical protein
MRRLPKLLALLIVASGAGPVTEPVPRIMDDTPEFCRSLAGRLAASPAARSEPSRTLGEQGKRLCDEGHFRIGVAKLRRALRAAQESH